MQPLSPQTPADRDQRLWQIAKARTKFQSHLVIYVLVNAGLWLLWAFTTDSDTHMHMHMHMHRQEVPWPIWSTVFWGIGIVSQGFAAYSGLNRGERTQREYERLLNQQQGL